MEQWRFDKRIMTNIYGLPQPLTGNETVTIQQEQNGQLALCTTSLSSIADVATFNFAAYADALPTSLPAASGIPWNNGGMISLS